MNWAAGTIVFFCLLFASCSTDYVGSQCTNNPPEATCVAIKPFYGEAVWAIPSLPSGFDMPLMNAEPHQLVIGDSIKITCNQGYITWTGEQESTFTCSQADSGRAMFGPWICTSPCMAGYYRDSASWKMGEETQCLNLDECSNGTHNCDASGNATCSDTTGSFTCSCDAGYSGDGVTCSNVNECSTGQHNCDSNAGCTDNDGSFACSCNAGYSGDGVTCSNVNECSTGQHNCSPYATCEDSQGSFSCVCNTGFSGDGVACDCAEQNGYFINASSNACEEAKSCRDFADKQSGFRVISLPIGLRTLYCYNGIGEGGWTLMLSAATAFCGSSTSASYNDTVEWRSCNSMSFSAAAAVAATASQIMVLAHSGTSSSTVELKDMNSRAESNNPSALAAMQTSTGNWHSGSGSKGFTNTQGSLFGGWGKSCNPNHATGWPNMFHGCGYTNNVHWSFSYKFAAKHSTRSNFRASAVLVR